MKIKHNTQARRDVPLRGSLVPAFGLPQVGKTTLSVLVLSVVLLFLSTAALAADDDFGSGTDAPDTRGAVGASFTYGLPFDGDGENTNRLAGDWDYMRFTLTALTQVRFRLTKTARQSGMTIYRREGSNYFQVAIYSQSSSDVDYTVSLSAATYYVGVTCQAAQNASHPTSYNLRIEVVNPCTDADGDHYYAQSGCGTDVDCNDAVAAIHPNAAEICDDGLDNNCSGAQNEGCVTYYRDSDGDTYGNPGVTTRATSPPAGYVLNNTDCDDTVAAIHPGAVEICDGIDNNCIGGTDEGCLTWYRDSDGDTYGNAGVSMRSITQPAGYVGNSTDCNDAVAAIHPGAVEVCDGVDNDCDTTVDEGCLTWYRDSDGDTYGNPGVTTSATSQPAGYVSDHTDCDDTRAAVHPGAVEICDDGLDNNCSGGENEGCLTWYRDSDGDTYGDVANSTSNIVQPPGYVGNSTDCNDANPAINPGAMEVCDGVNDDDCDGSVDEGCLTWYRDSDGDTYGNPADFTSAFTPPAGYVGNSADCNDADPLAYPGAAEVCDGADNNCDGSVDEGCAVWYRDSDGDNFGDPNPALTLSSIAKPAGYASNNLDCDDANAAINPGVEEACDGVDNDCDGSVDEGCIAWYQDNDGDNYGNSGVSVIAVTPPAGYVSDHTDCDDTRAAVNPGAAEVCDGLDNNCVGGVDEGCLVWYQDSDGDNYGSAVSVTAITPPIGYVAVSGDCNDGNAAVHPGAAEVCDGLDNNCAGGVDEGCLTWYQDADGDTYGNGGVSVVSATQPAGYVARAGDCNDGNPAVHPGAVEVCGDGVDNDCAGGDAVCQTWYQDSDNDGYGNPGVSVVSADPPTGYGVVSGDCDDTDAAVNPGAVEVCGDGVDNDCAGGDAVCQTWYQDADGDGYGNPGASIQAAAKPHGYVADNTDCNDANAAVHPGAVEVCGDGVDNDCAGGDAVCQTWYQDADGDGYGNPGASIQAAAKPHGYVADNTDCNDSDVTINPGAVEVCGDGVDNDCAGGDAACQTWYQDSDGDNYGNPGASIQAAVQPHGYVADNTDCNDGNAAVNPGAVEVCGDGVDNDCAGGDAVCQTWYQDSDGDGYGNNAVSIQAESRPHGYVADNTDCNDGNAAVNPGVKEICGDGIDNNCDGWDPGCCTYYRDADGDGHGSMNPADAVQNECGPLPGGYVWSSDDCDDANPAVHPGAAEVCNGVDDNCVGGIDEGCNACYHDGDNDGYGDPADPRPCAPGLSVPNGLDCNDSDPNVHPGAAEICGDWIDNDCDNIGDWDEGCRNWYQDLDGDGFGNGGVWMMSMTQPPGYVLDGGDCNDNNPGVYPGAEEVCDGQDNNCNGQKDEACSTWYEDSDGDSYGNPAVSVSSPVRPYGFTGDSTDCDDTNPGVHPKAAEVCNGVDDNCVNGIDEGCSACYDDADGDGYGNPAVTKACGPGAVPNGLDCDDTNPGVHPGAAEICWNGIDDDCSGGDGCANPYYRDADGDGHGDPGNMVQAEYRPDGYVWNSDDCDDTNPAVHPWAAEVCNGVDDNCAGGIDEGCSACFDDADGDGYGDPSDPQPCGATSVPNGLDCNDSDPGVHPGAAEVCGDGLDNDCDNLWDWDEGCRTWRPDFDGDGYGNDDWALAVSSTTQPAGYVIDAWPFDCDDDDPAVHPGATELCDGKDNNCNGQTDEGCDTWYEDSDGDNYGNPSVSVTSPVRPYGYVGDSTDCDDSNPAVHPNAVEICGDGLDNDCAGGDAVCQTWYRDNDGDNYGDSGDFMQAADQPPGYVSDSTDCDDTNPAVNPGAVEVCGDGVDNDCAGGDAACTTWYRDADGDNYGDSADSLSAADQPPGYVLDGTDCDDGNFFVHPGAVEICDNFADEDCDGIDAVCQTWYRDADGDNYGNSADSMNAAEQQPGYVTDGTDCDDANAAVHPGAVEICGDGLDNDCAGGDAVCQTWYRDSDNDNYGNSADFIDSADQPPGYVTASGDCDDANAAVHPGATEICGDGLDNDCAGGDAACTTWYRDVDHDGYGNPGVSVQAEDRPDGYVANDTDCNDGDAAINPAAVDICDGIDNNCSGGADEGCRTWYQDSDGDGYGNPGAATTQYFQPAGYVSDNTDCNDGNAAIHPGATEICGDGIDNNCAGGVDEGCLVWYRDSDSDNYGNPAVFTTAIVQPAGFVSNATDCNDGNAAIHPGATEVCDGIDNNCAGGVDEGCDVWYRDSDGDTYGDPAHSIQSITKPAGYVSDTLDCNDANAAINPAAVELCDGMDNDCDFTVDEGCILWYQDSDGDNYGNAAVTTLSVNQPAGYVADSTDCNDGDPLTHPGGTEVCDGINDEDCDGSVDEGCVPWYQDSDGDTYGNAGVSIMGVTQPAGYVANSTDCNDGDPLIHPGGTEVCDGINDEDCDGSVDEGCVPWYQDSDGDTYGNAGVSIMGVTQPAGYVADSTDCNDSDPLIHPGGTEVCDGINDEDCDGSVDEGCVPWYRDSDGDTYGNAGVSIMGVIQPAGYVANSTDCNDGDPLIHPGGTEVCDGSVDEDCDGSVDEGCQTWYEDSDGDTYGGPAVTIWAFAPPPVGYVGNDTDCNDGNAAIHPGATEVCDGIDNNCDGIVDEGCSFWYQDSDGDVYGNHAIAVWDLAPPAGYLGDDTDCNDGNAAINPGATEICDGIDNNCDGAIDDVDGFYYPDHDGDGWPSNTGEEKPCLFGTGYPGYTFEDDLVDFNGDGHVDFDCDDSVADPANGILSGANTHPGAAEICDGRDNDCDGVVDEGLPVYTYYYDNDNDGWGVAGTTTTGCSRPTGYAPARDWDGDGTSDWDCNDNEASIHPGAYDPCYTTLDENCSGDNTDCTEEPMICANLANYPLETQVASADPLVEFLIDDSGSMAYEVIFKGALDGAFYYKTSATAGRTCQYVFDNIASASNCNDFYQPQCYTLNSLYYNPHVDYEPWPTHANANPTTPRRYPDTTTTINLTDDFDGSSKVNNVHWCIQNGTNVYLVTIESGTTVKYYSMAYTTTTTYYGQFTDAKLTLVANPATLPADVLITRTPALEQQNFANWFMYYRTRQNTAKAAILKTIASTSGVKMGVHTINHNNGVTLNNTGMLPVDLYEGTIRGYVEDVGASGGTPLRVGLKDVGRYFAGTYPSVASPLSVAADGGECQQMFAIVMTDGYWNESTSLVGVGNTDGTGTTGFEGGIYGDTYSNTLADVAMNYYKTDLSATLANVVPTNEHDSATHQHMVTYTISFGMKGALDPDAYDMSQATTTCPTGSTCTAAAPCACAPTWPNAQANTDTTIDDLWHASVNGRGKFLIASNATQLAQSLEEIMLEVSARTGSGASVAVNTQTLEEGTMLYQGSYNSAGWTGDLKAYAVDRYTGDVVDTPDWSSSDVLSNPALTDWATRNIYTYNPVTHSGVTFARGNLSTLQKLSLGSTAAEQDDIIDFVKGDKSNDANHGGTYRARQSILGDIVHSAPVHIGDTIYVGANDGMLHAFDAHDGSERWAYIPSFVYTYGYLKLLADPQYEHKYFVDNTPYIYGDANKILVGGLGKGGKGYFALDVSSPDTFGTADVLWEYPTAVDQDMGYSFSMPIIVPDEVGNVILFGNGYDSENGHAVLYVLNTDGTVRKKFDTGEGGTSSANCNGLSTPLAIDVDFDGFLDYVYAGDLQGNLWKFDMTGDTDADWGIFYYHGSTADPEPLFRARDASANYQPITTRPAAMRHCLANRSGYIIVFGTGKFISLNDFSSTATQTLYGVWDWSNEWLKAGITASAARQLPLGTGIVNLPGPVNLNMLQQSVLSTTTGDFHMTSDVGLYDKPRPTLTPPHYAWFSAPEYVDEGAAYNGGTYIGWRLDLPSGNGERMIADPTIREGYALFVTVQPSNSPCKSGGNSYLTIVDACDGGLPDEAVLDVTNDGIVDGDDVGWNRKELDDIYYKPVIIDDKLYFSEDDPERTSREKLGVAYWRFLRILGD